MSVAITDEVDSLLEQKKQQVGAKTKEGFVHSILLLALTDDDFLRRAKELSDFLGGGGAGRLRQRDL